MKLPSVTKILDATMAPEKRAALEAWKERVGAEEAERIRQAAFLRGRTIDDQVEIFAHTGTCDDNRITNYLAGYSFLARELPVVSNMHGYQGRLDAVLRGAPKELRKWSGLSLSDDTTPVNILVDFKGTNRWKQKKYLDDYRLQLGAYYGACMESGLSIDCACVVLFIDDKDAPQLYWQQRHELDEAHGMFVEKVKQYKAMVNEVSA